MNTIQRWLIVIAMLLLAIGVLLHAFTGRYKLPILDNEEEFVKTDGHMWGLYEARYDTWTGRFEVTQLDTARTSDKKTGKYPLHWVAMPTHWVKDLK